MPTPRSPQSMFPFPIAEARPLSLAEVEIDVSDLDAFMAYIQDRRGASPALIGGYDEDRSVYSSELFRVGSEARTIHLGVDVWTDAATPIGAPLAAEVHSRGINDGLGDYGGTVILAHRSVEGLRDGQAVAAGEVFAWLGSPAENGGWPPHLHFQRIEDMLGYRGDFPGVATRADRARWLALCPNPMDLLV